MWDYSWDDYRNQSPFDATQTITSAVIGEGVTSIGAWFFDDCHNLTSISLPSTLQRIEEGAFYDNDLAELTIPDGVTYIGKWAFTHNHSFTSLTLPNSVTELGVAPFSYCTGLINVTLSEGLTEIPEAAFAQCSAMTDITIPDSVTSILAEAFDGCDSLTTIHGVPGSYAETFANAFGYTFASAATTASGTCGDGVNWTLYDGGKMIISGSGSMDSYSSSSHAPWYDNWSSVTSVTIRDGVTSIGAYAFSDCVYLTDVSIPDSVTSIGAYAFSCCVNLTDVSIPGGVKNVGECAFNGCTSLTNVSISSSTATFGSDVFAGCPAGLTLHGYEGSTTEAYAIANGIDFNGWPSSESGSCGDSVSWTLNHLTNTLTISGTGAMEDYYVLADYYLYEPGWYGMRDSIYTVVIENGITTIGKYAFYKMSAISSVTIPNSVTSILAQAFDGCDSLTTIHGVPGSYAETFANAFGYTFASAATTASGTCGDGVNWTLYDGGKMIISGSGSMDSYSSSSHAPWYDNWSSVTSVTIRDGVTSIGAYAFSDCVYLTDVSIPDSVTSIGAYAFSCCVNLTDVSIPGGVKNVGECAFNGCTSLTNVSISSSTATFGSDVFAGCPAGLTLHGYEGSTTEAYAIANGIDFDGWSSSESGSCGDSMSWTLSYLTNTLTISGTGDMEDYSENSHPSWYALRDSVYAVVIENGITTIGNYAFYEMSAIRSVTIPNSVTWIYTCAFENCSGLTHVTIPESVEFISLCAFYGCSNLTSATILSPTVSIGAFAKEFDGCASDFTLYGYYNSTASDYAAAVGYQFSLLAPAPDFFLPAVLTTIESEAFSGIAAQAAVIPKTVTAITGNPFDGGMVNTVYGYPGTAAQIYANTYSKTFVPLSDEYLSKLQP